MDLMNQLTSLWEHLLQYSTSTLLLITLMILLAFSFYNVFIFPMSHFQRIGLPGPKPWIFAGNIPTIIRMGGQHVAHYNLIREYGKVFGMYYATEPVTVVSDYGLIKEILIQDFFVFRNRRVPFEFPLKYLSKVLTIARDEEWKTIRASVTPTFTTSKLKAVLPIITEPTDELVATLIQHSQNKQIINARDVFGRFTMDVILSVAFGVQTSSHQQKSELTVSASKIFSGTALKVALNLILPRFLLALIMKTPYDFDGKYFRHLDRVARAVIKSRRQSNSCQRMDVLQLMLDAKENGKLSDDEIVAQCVVFLLAGYETTANTLSSTAYALAIHPEVQRKLHKEIDDAFANSNGSLNYENINELSYLDMVICEALRIYSPVAVVMREAAQDHIINDIKFIKGTIVLIPVYTIHRDSEQWPDPEKFIPERFTQEEKAKRNPFSYLPFGSGPRNCIGMRFALMETKLALAKILHRIEFVQVAETEVPLQLSSSVTLSSKNAIKVGVKER